MADPPETWRRGHRAHLDGVRAVAVYLVVAFHAGLGRAGNGFIGVDVFFVLSGYLVTNLLLRDLMGADGRIRFGRFYARRVRRLLPAASVALITTAVVFGAVAAPVELADARSGIRAAALYVANWHFIRQAADYFAPDVAANPVVHYWSLSVEEQFYLLWPGVLTAAWWLARRAGARRIRAMQAMVAVGAVASAAWAVHLAPTRLDRAYYGTDTRAYQLLAGALLALAPGAIERLRRTPRVAAAAAPVLVAALVMLATGVVGWGPIWRGIAVAIVTVALLAALDAARGGPARAVLGWAPVAYLGQVSYSTYLWHWLVIVVLTREAELSPLATAALTAAVATGLASLSYQIMERPVRVSPALDRMRPAVIATGLTMSVLVALVVSPAILDRASGTTEERAGPVSAGVSGEMPTKTDLGRAYFDVFDFRPCAAQGKRPCILVPGPPGGRRAIVVGESHAGMLTPMLEQLAERHHTALYGGYLSYCPWVRGIKYHGVGPTCFADQADLYDHVIPKLDPDIVFLAHRPVDDPQDPFTLRDEGFTRAVVGPKKQEQALDERLRALVNALRAQGRTVVIFEPTPLVGPAHDPLTCLSGATSLAACRFVASAGPLGEERTIRSVAAHDRGVVPVDLDPMVCPYLPICDPVVDGLIVRADSNHLTVTYAKSIADQVDRVLEGNGVWGR